MRFTWTSNSWRPGNVRDNYREIARRFCSFYYKTYDTNFPALARLYKQNSMFTYIDREIKGFRQLYNAVVASGIYTVLGVQPPIFGSPNVVELLASGLKDVVGANFAVEPDPEKAAVLIRRHLESKRQSLGLPFIEPESITMPAEVAPIP